MSENAISAHGTKIERQTAGAGPFEILGEVRDITLPGLTRNEIETTSHNDDEEHFTVGIRRKGPMDFQIGYRPSLDTHKNLVTSWRNGSRDVWRVTFPDGPDPDTPRVGGTQWLFSGYVTNVSPSAPMDDGLVADCTVRPTNTMTFIDAEV
jgi:hypothetical protein